MPSCPADPVVPAVPSLRAMWLPLVGLALMFGFFCAWSMTSPSTGNAMARLGLAHSIVAHGTLTIDEIAPIEKDRAFFNGHYYCDKAPGVSLICLPPVAVANVAMDLAGLDDAMLTSDLKRSQRFFGTALACLFGALIPLSALGVLAFFRSLLHAGVDPPLARAGTLLFAFGTPFLYWSASIFGHATAGALLTIGFAQYWTLGRSPAGDRLRLLVAGFALALAVTVEFIAAPASAAIGLLIAFRGPREPADWRPVLRAALTLAAGGAIPAVLLLGYNYLAFGAPLHLGYSQVDGWEGMKTGFFGISAPSLPVLWELTFGGYRGIVWLSPVLIPAAYGCAKLAWQGPHRAIGILCLGIAAYYFCINAGYYYWDGGWSTGPRHATPAFGFLLFGLVLAFPGFSRPLRLVTAASAAYSVLAVVIVALIDSRARETRHNVLLEHVLPHLMTGKSEMFLVHLGMPFALAMAVPLILFGLFVWWFRPGLGSPALQQSRS